MQRKLNESQRFDKIFREISPVFLSVFIEKVLKLDIVESVELKDKLQLTRQRETDTLRKVTDRKGDTYILHVEIHRANDKRMPLIMLDYWVLIYGAHELPIRQYVLYIGPESMDMSDRIEKPNLSFRFQMISFKELPYELFLESDRTEVKMLALLADLKDADPYEVTEQIVKAINEEPVEVSEKEKRTQQLRILTQLRTFESLFEKAMVKLASFFKEERDPFYIKGEERGKLEGKEEGKLEGKEIVVENLITKLGFSNKQAADIAEVSMDFVQNIRTRLAKKA
ncbi:conserved hypothetical protein (putative transposase or invertase) [bacterium A37T11]|nr:conserved hypothetical protein (putative transposase or invertase) [bacterium A37T11]